MRRGLIKDINEVFDAADEMLGNYYCPEDDGGATLYTERERYKALRREVIASVRALQIALEVIDKLRPGRPGAKKKAKKKAK